MKVTVKNASKVVKSPSFPHMRIDPKDDCIMLALRHTSSGYQGVIIAKGSSSAYVGSYSDSFNESCFSKVFEGSVTLESEKE